MTVADKTYIFHSDLSLRAPDALKEAVLLGKPVNGVVALAHGADEAAKGVCLVIAGVTTVLIDLADADLDGAVVLGLDDAAGGAALAGDVDCAVMLALCDSNIVGEASVGGVEIQWRGRLRQRASWGQAYGRRARRVRSPW
jgi:hypothetical protein